MPVFTKFKSTMHTLITNATHVDTTEAIQRHKGQLMIIFTKQND